MLHSTFRTAIIIVVLFFNFCLRELDISKEQIRLFQYLILSYSNIEIKKQSNKINEGQIIKIYIKLKNEPFNNVTVPINVNSNLIQINKNQLTFTSSNWNEYQEIQLYAIEDFNYINNHDEYIYFGPFISSDFFYDGKTNSTSIFYINNDSKGINISISNPTEGGANGILNLSLKSKPKGNVTFNIMNPSPSDFSFSITSLTFTPSNWNLPQSITITAIDDTLTEYTENFNIEISSSSSDKDYDNLSLTIPISIYDNDIPGFTLNLSSFSIQEGSSQIANIHLNTAPSNNVNITITANPSSLCSISAGNSLTFTPANYNIDQSFTIQAKPLDNIDNITESPTNCTVTITSTSVDLDYNNLTQNIKGEIYDYLNAGIILNNNGSIALGTLLESGNTSSFTIRLQSEPSSNVIVCFKSNNYCEATVDTIGINPPNGTCISITGFDVPYITFDNLNWNMNQTITIKARHDWDYRSGGLSTEDGNPCNPPYPDGNKSFSIQIYTYCPGCNSNEQIYYHTNTNPYTATPSGTVQDDLDYYSFVTANGHNGDFANDATLSGTNAIEKADNFCTQQNPGLTGTFKTLLVDGINRSACGTGTDYPTCSGKINWVLKPNKYYFRNTDDQLLFKTDTNGFFIFGDPNANGIPGSTYIWTGIEGTPSLIENWSNSTNNCLGWSSTLLVGKAGKPINTNTYNAISDNTYSCNLTLKLLCIQQ